MATISEKPIRVVLADDHLLLREGVASIVSAQTDMVVVGEATNDLEAVSVYREHLPDLILMDLQMPEMDGVEAIGRISAEFPDARIIVLTTYSGDVQALRALRAGAVGYLLKNTLRKEMLQAILSAHHGGKHLDSAIAADIALHATDELLSDREREVLQLAARGNSNRQMAIQLGLSEETVKGHMKSIFSKLTASCRTHAVMIAAKRGIIEL